LGAGEIGYETDTGKFKIGTGAATWTSLGYFNQDPVTTKGDLYTFSTTDARLAVGNNGETLVADSSATTGLRWQGNYAAGKNKIINGDFGVWQRGTSFTNPGVNAYTADRWLVAKDGSGATVTVSQQTFTPGAAPVAGYEGQFFFRYAQSVAGSGATFNIVSQRIEDVRQLAGQTVTVSFYAKAASALTLASIDLAQVFGGGGSGSVNTALSGSLAITTSWTRFTYTVSLPSISGKTIGTNPYLAFRIFLPNNAIQTLDLWGVQIEAGSTASPFQTATGTKQGELAACQRYYWRAGGQSVYQLFGIGIATSSTNARIQLVCPVQMRTLPSSVDFSTLVTYDAAVQNAVTNVTIAQGGTLVTSVDCTSTVLTISRATQIIADNSTSAYIGLNAEL
jgi:hypothetical protein